MSQEKPEKGEVILYKTPQNETELVVKLSKETVWLSLDQMATLFDRDKSVISRHIKNIFQEKELNSNSVVAKYATTAADGKTYRVDYYNLDVIISVGYRIKSQNGVRFRIWASKILKQYLIKGYAINEKRLLEVKNRLNDLKQTITFLQGQSKKKLLKGQEAEILQLLADYSKTLSLLQQYDQKKIKTQKGKSSEFILEYETCRKIIDQLKQKLIQKEEAGGLFAQEQSAAFISIIKGLYQTFNKKLLYPTVEDKAAHLLYLIVKDHPFIDGNKRSAAFLFIYYLDQSNHLFRSSGERKINDNALTALTLLIAESDPKDKEIMIKIVKQLLAD